jgi:sugar lactone lactonase YvrE
MPPELVLDARAELGEGPAWDAASNCLYWVDLHSGALHVFNPQSMTDSWFNLSEPVGSVAICRSGDLLVALRSGLALLDPLSQNLTRLVSPEPHLPGNRFNDGKCDPAGRFLAGTMDDAEMEASGSLYSYSPDGTLKTLLTGLRISNGLAWSPDQRTFYFIDTPTRQVTAFDYDGATGAISNSRPVVTVPPELGWPDGMTSDAEGMLWVAMWGGASLTRWDPATGKLLASIPIPALNVTCCAFGGSDLSDLYVTTARKRMDARQLEEYPFSGGLFRLRTKTPGIPGFVFG